MDHAHLSAIDKMFEELRKSFDDVQAAQNEINQVTGTAWSDNHLIKVVVGPRGQLVDLEIDPRAVRRVNTEALAATILSTARAAAEEALGRTRDLVDRDLPDMREVFGTAMPSAVSLAGVVFEHDTDLVRSARKSVGKDDDEPRD